MPPLRANPVLAVRDLDESAAWFARVLGTDNEEVDPGNWVFCRTGSVTFMLGHCPDSPPARELGNHSYLAYLVVDDVDAIHANAVEAGAEVGPGPTDEEWGMREFGIATPDGHRFTFGQPID